MKLSMFAFANFGFSSRSSTVL